MNSSFFYSLYIRHGTIYYWVATTLGQGETFQRNSSPRILHENPFVKYVYIIIFLNHFTLQYFLAKSFCIYSTNSKSLSVPKKGSKVRLDYLVIKWKII